MRTHTADRLRARGHQHIARHRATYERLRECYRCVIVVGPSRDETPKSPDVLSKFAHHQIAAVAAKIAARGIVLGNRQCRRTRLFRIEQGAIGIKAILIAIAQQELSCREQIAVVEIRGRVWLALGGPVDARLAHAIHEAERLLTAHVRRGQTIEHGEAIAESRFDLSTPRIQVFSGVQHEQNVRLLWTAPAPQRRRAGPQVAEAARPSLVACQAGDELSGKSVDDAFRHTQCAHATRRQRDVQRATDTRLAQLLDRRYGLRCDAKPGARRSRVGHSQQQEARFLQRAIARPQQALNVGEFVVWCCHRVTQIIASQRSASATVIVWLSRPSRIRVLRAKSAVVSPG